jgi:hypothetical protein
MEKLSIFMYALIKNARRDSFVDFLEYWDITWEEYEEIVRHFEDTYEIGL